MKSTRALCAALILCSVGLALSAGPRSEQASSDLAESFDVIVYGSEPEAIVAAVAAAEEGASVALISSAPRLGGLFVLGELNVLDLKTQPHDYQLGLFDRWWSAVGRQEAFDVGRAEAAFASLLAAAGVVVELSVSAVEPLHSTGGDLAGVAFVSADGVVRQLSGAQLVDGSADAELAAATDAIFTLGWQEFGVDQRMADTLVFRVADVDWARLRDGVVANGRAYAVAKDTVVWGHFGGAPAQYRPTLPGLRLRGLNLGRQRDGTVLVNALLIYGIDPLDQTSRTEGRLRALEEAPRVVAYLAQHVPGFERASFAGGAEELYVRESRHLRADCVLSADDVLGNNVTALDVAAGGYPLDAQTFTPHDSGFVFGTPDIYGGRLCMLVPAEGPADLWVVGRSAGYDPVAFASARVVPFGMAMAEAAGVAAAMAVSIDVSAREVATDATTIRAVRERLAQRGAYLPNVAPRPGVGPTAHPYYQAFRTLVSRGLTVAGYENDPRLDQPVTVLSFAYLVSNVATRFHGRPEVGQGLVDVALAAAGGDGQAPLDARIAALVTHAAACAVGPCPEAGWAGLWHAGLTEQQTEPGGQFSRGEAYALAAAVATYGADR